MNQRTAPADVLGCLAHLEQVRQAPELRAVARAGDPDLLRRAAGDLARALGQCELFGVRSQAGPGLSAELTRAAAEEWSLRLAEALEGATQLGEDWDACPEPGEARSLVLGMLETRMDAWAAFVAIEEGYQAAAGGRRDLDPLLDALMDGLDALDEVLEPQAPLLAAAAETELLANWRANLAEPYSLGLPWWLDGRLEALALRAGAHIPESRRVGLPRQSPRVVQPSPPAHLPEVRELALAASNGGIVITPGGAYRWPDPRGGTVAVLRVPESCSQPADPLVVTFQNSEGRRTTALDGWRVRLGLREGTVANGKFELTRADLGSFLPAFEAGRPGAPLETWPVPPENAP